MRSSVALIGLFLLSLGCKDPIPDPEAAILEFPANNLDCIYVSIDSSEAEVLFQWIEALHTDTYRLTVQNIESGHQYVNSTKLQQLTLRLTRGFPYQWKVTSTSEASAVEADSQTRYFYLEGEQQFVHVPFPASLISPQNNAIVSLGNGELDFSWEGADLDDDIESYSFYLGESQDTLVKIAENLSTASFRHGVNRDAQYYWRVVTFDRVGNSSNSQIFGFRTAP